MNPVEWQVASVECVWHGIAWYWPVMGCLHDSANVQQTFSANVSKIQVLMLDVCRKFAGSLLDICWIV